MTIAPQLSAADVSQDIIEPQLSFLACQAAIELDCVRTGRESGLRAVHKLAERLRNSLARSENGSGTQSSDPTMRAVLGRALTESLSGEPIKTVDELILEAGKVADRLSNPSSNEWAMNFCVALSRAASAFRQSMSELRPQNPHRK